MGTFSIEDLETEVANIEVVVTSLKGQLNLAKEGLSRHRGALRALKGRVAGEGRGRIPKEVKVEEYKMILSALSAQPQTGLSSREIQNTLGFNAGRTTYLLQGLKKESKIVKLGDLRNARYAIAE